MRNLFYLLFILVLTSCNKTNKPIDNQFMDEYRYPADSLIDPKVFVYENNDSLDKLSFYLRQVKVENGNKICIYVELDNDNSTPRRDSTVYYYQGKNLILRDEYTLFKNSTTNKDRVFKSEILDYSDYSQKKVIKTKYRSPLNESLICTNTDVSFFAKKTTFKIYDKDVKCIIMANNINVKIHP